MLVVGSGEHQNILEIRFLNRPLELITPLDLLQPMLGHTQRQIDDLAPPDVDRVVQCPNDRFYLAAALGPENVGGVEFHPRSQGKNNVGDGRTMWGGLFPIVGQDVRPVGSEYGSL